MLHLPFLAATWACRLRQHIPGSRAIAHAILPWSAERVKEAILSCKYDVVRCNFPNSDMVGHTGKLEATVISCAAADRGVKVRVVRRAWA